MLPNFDKHMESIRKSVRAFPWENAYSYGMYIAQTYYYVRHSTRLLGVAAGRMSYEDGPFHQRFLEHAVEEKGHELMARNDLKALGFTLEDFPELPETRMFWETQYYKIEHIDPLALMGYILALEAVACRECPWVKEKLIVSHKGNCYSFFKVHGEEDQEHVKKAFEQILALPADRLRWVNENFEQTAMGLCNLLDNIKKRSLEQSQSLVA